jgi:hypothetical protein
MNNKRKMKKKKRKEGVGQRNKEELSHRPHGFSQIHGML